MNKPEILILWACKSESTEVLTRSYWRYCPHLKKSVYKFDVLRDFETDGMSMYPNFAVVIESLREFYSHNSDIGRAHFIFSQLDNMTFSQLEYHSYV